MKARYTAVQLVWYPMLLLSLAGCAGIGGMGERASLGAMSAAPADAPREAAVRPAPKASAALAPSSQSGAAAPARRVVIAATGEAAQAGSAPGATAGKRLRVFSGSLDLVVGEVEKARERIIEATGHLGGYVETATAEYVVVRVPAASFDAAMRELSTLGEVRARSVESTDVTESYADLARRVEIAKRTRARLYDLLGKATDVEERVSISGRSGG